MFLIYFIVVPIVLLAGFFIAVKSAKKIDHIRATGILIVLAVTYTTPWDNYLVANKVWWYGPDRVIETIGYVPVEEYIFFALQTLLAGLWSYFVNSFMPISYDKTSNAGKKMVIFSFVLLLGIGIICLNYESTLYLGLILSWAMPIILLQWTIGGQYIMANRTNYILNLAVPTIYLWFVDSFAIGNGIWEISSTKTIGLNFGHLPFEEALFFLVTNMMVGQGLLLFLTMKDKINTILSKMRFKIS